MCDAPSRAVARRLSGLSGVRPASGRNPAIRPGFGHDRTAGDRDLARLAVAAILLSVTAWRRRGR